MFHHPDLRKTSPADFFEIAQGMFRQASVLFRHRQTALCPALKRRNRRQSLGENFEARNAKGRPAIRQAHSSDLINKKSGQWFIFKISFQFESFY